MGSRSEWLKSFAEGKIDAFVANRGLSRGTMG